MAYVAESFPGKIVRVSARHLPPNELGGVIFPCTDLTMEECLTKQIFGLPPLHYRYVVNIQPGLPLFLYNSSTRQLHGIFEAASSGQRNINPHGWTKDDSEKTPYPAQVQIRVRENCHPLSEKQFKPIIKDNYFTQFNFLYELDHHQVNKLIPEFLTQVVTQFAVSSGSGASSCLDRIQHPASNAMEAMNEDEMNLQSLPGKGESSVSYVAGDVQKFDGSRKGKMAQEENTQESSLLPSDTKSITTKLKESLGIKQESTEMTDELLHGPEKLHSEEQSQERLSRLEAMSNQSETYACGTMESSSEQHLDPDGLIYIVGGSDGPSWLASLESYSPSNDSIMSLRDMPSVRSYAALATLKGDLYVIGGGFANVMYDSVLTYSPAKNEWTLLLSLNKEKGGLAATTFNEKIFAIGGGYYNHFFSDVEMFDIDVERWIPARSMRQKRLDLAAVELNGVFYAVGGYDGTEYLSSAERYDPRENSWSRLESMSSKRACHSMVVLNEKLYAIGGFDGSKMVASVEVFDPRHGSWMKEAPMNQSRGFSAAVTLSDSIYAIGGVGEDLNGDCLETVERYQEGGGWQLTSLKGVGKRAFASAIVM